MIGGELTKTVQEFVKANFAKPLKGETIGVADARLAQALKDKFDIKAVCNDLSL